jgi:two-component sensor histidine kinase
MEGDGDDISKIKELLKNEPRGMSIRQIADQLPINRNLVAKNLDILLVSGQVEMRTIGMAKIYYLSHRVPISAMMDFSSDFIVVLDESLRIIQINDHFLSFAAKTREDIVGKTIGSETLPLLAGERSLAAARDALKGKEIPEDIVFGKDSAAFHYHAKFIPTVFENGAPGVTAILEDTTDIWRAEQTLRKTLEEKDELLGDINQRINNNLQLVMSFIELQMATLPDVPAREVLRETQNRIMALALVYGQIGPAHPGSRVALDSYTRNLARALCSSYGLPEGSITATAASPDVTMAENKATATGLVLNELTSYLLSTGTREVPATIGIGLTSEALTGFTIRISYSGLPLPGDIELSTTGLLGLQLAYTLVTKQLGGTLRIPGDRQGFVITLPPD